MAKSLEYNKARKMRSRGGSIRDIANAISVAKSTVSLWCRDIQLTPRQIEKLQGNRIRGGYAGRLKGARMQYERRIQRTQEFEGKGKNLLGKLSVRDILSVGLGLYWGEGTTYGRRAEFTNSDPFIIRFILRWFKQVFHFDTSRFKFYILINEIHKDRLKEVQKYWVKITGISQKSFGKTTLIKAKNKKVYANFATHYGTLKVCVKKPVEIHHQIMGMLKELEGNV
ncbi:MAG: hypothetical protein Q7R55_01090 [Candidatus Wildermuthbacteria bacterium]|nr:hypothetical protein [Candidatus Wildermuthbacteria bacterium]